MQCVQRKTMTAAHMTLCQRYSISNERPNMKLGTCSNRSTARSAATEATVRSTSSCSRCQCSTECHGRCCSGGNSLTVLRHLRAYWPPGLGPGVAAGPCCDCGGAEPRPSPPKRSARPPRPPRGRWYPPSPPSPGWSQTPFHHTSTLSLATSLRSLHLCLCLSCYVAEGHLSSQ